MAFGNTYEFTYDVDVIQNGPENAYEQKKKNLLNLTLCTEYPRIENASSQCRTQQYVKSIITSFPSFTRH